VSQPAKASTIIGLARRTFQGRLLIRQPLRRSITTTALRIPYLGDCLLRLRRCKPCTPYTASQKAFLEWSTKSNIRHDLHGGGSVISNVNGGPQLRRKPTTCKVFGTGTSFWPHRLCTHPFLRAKLIPPKSITAFEPELTGF
jgi:hypothetical protein